MEIINIDGYKDGYKVAYDTELIKKVFKIRIN